jgi:hypothetical protein
MQIGTERICQICSSLTRKPSRSDQATIKPVDYTKASMLPRCNFANGLKAQRRTSNQSNSLKNTAICLLIGVRSAGELNQVFG